MKFKEIYIKTVNLLLIKGKKLLEYIYFEENIEERRNNILNMTKKETDIHKYYLIIDLIRYILLTTFAIVIFGYPLIQITLMLSLNVIFFILTLFSNPFKKKFTFYLTITGEFLINCCFLICWILAICEVNDYKISLEQKMNMGWGFMASDIFLMYALFIFNGFRILKGVFNKIWNKKKVEIQPIKEDNN